MATVDFNSAVYYTISDGKICRQFREAQEGTKERVNKTGRIVHEKFYRGLSGRIVDIATKDGDYGKSWLVTLQDDTGTREILQFQYSSGYANGFLRALPNVDLSKPVTISPKMTIEGDKKKTTIFINQGGQAIKWYYTKDTPHDIPQLQQQKVKGKMVWDDSEQMEFLENMVNTEILPKLKGVTVSDDEEDAPF
jgi:hypothetical protein